MWQDLNIQQKTELIRDYVRNGITSLSDMQAMYDQQSQEQAPVRTFINGQPKWRPRVLGGEGRPRPRQMTLDDAVALATEMAYEQIRQERERGYALGGNLFEDGGDTERDKLWQQVYNSRGSANLPYEQAKDYDVKYYPDGSVKPMTYEEWVGNVKGYKGKDGILNKESGLTLGQAYDAYRNMVEQDNSEYLKLKYPESINQQRSTLGLGTLGQLSYFGPQNDYIQLPDPASPEGYDEETATFEEKENRIANSAKYRMMTNFDNLRKYGRQYDINNWRESLEYNAQNSRYQDELRRRGFPIRNYGDGSVGGGSKINLYSSTVKVPTRNAYGEMWYPLPEKHKDNVSGLSGNNLYFNPEKDDEIGMNEYMGRLNPVTTLIHEFGHSRIPDAGAEEILENDYNLKIPDYFTRHNGTEASARASQVLNYHNFTLDDVDKMNSEDFRQAYWNYLRGYRRQKDGTYRWTLAGPDNNMMYLYNMIDHRDNWNQFFNWLKGNNKNWNMYKKGGSLV